VRVFNLTTAHPSVFLFFGGYCTEKRLISLKSNESILQAISTWRRRKFIGFSHDVPASLAVA